MTNARRTQRSNAKRNALWSVSILTRPEADDAISNILQELLNESVVSYTDVETEETRVSVYLPKKPDWPNLERNLKSALAQVRRCGLQTGPARIVLQKVRREDWAESWKRHFKAIQIGSSLLIKPSWIRRKPRAGQAVIVLDPGLSFGTGQHPTTSFCLRQLVAASKRLSPSPPSLLDIGTGSGVLAIAAAKLGFSPVEAFDFDPESIRVARENARRNRVTKAIHLHQADLTKLPKRGPQFDVVCANLISTLLIAERDRIIHRVRAGGVLILAGILKTEFDQVKNAFAARGLKLVASKAENEWRSGAFRTCRDTLRTRT